MAWISGNRYLSTAEMQNNATLIHLYFRTQGWTDNAIAGMLGNMQSESSINPGIWENLTPPEEGQTNVGYGLVQWTPYTNYSNWAGSGWEDNGTKECERINYELQNGLQWISTNKYPLSFVDYSTSNLSPSYLAQAWLYNYERPSDLDQPKRSEQAEYWYKFITGETPWMIPAWLLFKIVRRGLY